MGNHTIYFTKKDMKEKKKEKQKNGFEWEHSFCLLDKIVLKSLF